MRLSKTKNNRSTPQIIEQTYEQRQWLRKRGKGNRITFSQHMLDKLKNYFCSLDEDGSNSISPNELEDPLILFGLCKDKEEVTDLFKSTCALIKCWTSMAQEKCNSENFYMSLGGQRLKNGSKEFVETTNVQIEFLSSQEGTMFDIENKIDQGVSFRLGMSVFRRKHLINAIMSKNPKQKEEGQVIMKKFHQQIASNPLTKGKILQLKQMTVDYLPSLPRSNIKTHRRLKTTV